MMSEKKGSGIFVKMLIGGAVAVVGLVATGVFFEAFKTVVLGFIGPFLIVVGLVIVAVSKE